MGFQAPNEIPVHIKEVYLAIKRGEAKEKETKLGKLETNVDDSTQKQGGSLGGGYSGKTLL